MWWRSVVLLPLLVYNGLGAPFASKSALPIPEQVHLNLAEQPGGFRVHWVTMQPVADDQEPAVEFGLRPTALNQRACARTTIFESDGVVRFMYMAEMLDLKPATTYFYRVGAPAAFSKVFECRSFPAGNDFPLRDLGVDNGISLVHLLRASEREEFDLIIHTGDISYDLNTEKGAVGDIFMRGIEPIATRVPYLVIAGNHESYQNFSHYRHRFPSPPNDAFGDSQTYSFDLGPVHFVGISTEYLGFFYEYGKESVIRQHEWLHSDLEKANLRRNEHPFIVAFQHRPFYCSNTNSYECHAFENTLVRTGFEEMKGLESLFLEKGVDLAFEGHEHSYERFYPVADRRVYNLSRDPYHNSPAPVHVVSGSAGCHTPHAGFNDENPTPGSAARSVDYGYTMMHVLNKTSIYIEQISVEKGGEVIDFFSLTKDLGHRHSVKRSAALDFSPFPPLVEPSTCDMADPRCRWKRDSVRKLEN